MLGPPSPYLETDVLWWRGQALPSSLSPPVLIWHPRSRVYSPSSSKEPACRDRSSCDLSYPSPHLPWERVFPLGEVSLSVGDQEMVHWVFFFFFNLLRKFCVFVEFVIFQVASFFSLNFNCPNYQLTSGGLIWETCIFVTLHQSS